MRNVSKTVAPPQATARTVLTIHIDIEQLIAAVGRHVPLGPMAARAIRYDFVKHFDATRVTVASIDDLIGCV